MISSYFTLSEGWKCSATSLRVRGRPVHSLWAPWITTPTFQPEITVTDDINRINCYSDLQMIELTTCIRLFFWCHVQHSMRLPADPDERRVAIARRGLRGLPGQTRITSSWHCKQMTWLSWFSSTLLQPMCSLAAWIFMPVLILRTSRMSAPASWSSILLTSGGRTYYAWFLYVKAATSPVSQASLTPPTLNLSSADSPRLHHVSLVRLV